jgi:hypothetical protein
MDQPVKNPAPVITAASVAKAADPAKVAKKAAYEKELKERKKAARVRVLEFVKANVKDLGPLASDLTLLAGAGGSGKPRASTGVVRTINADIRAAFIEKKSLSEMDIFKTFHIGRPEMVNKRRVLVMCPNPADRLWVEFDEKAEVYNLVGTGPTPPAGFVGYIPEAKVL